MNVTVKTSTLAQELRLLNNIVPSKTTLPILSNVLIVASENVLKFSVTDYELGFTSTCPASVMQPGQVALPAKRLLDLVEQLPGADVQIIFDKQQVRIVSGAFKSRLQAMSADDFPRLPSVEGQTSTLAGHDLHLMTHRVRYAISDKTKYMINGALLTLAGPAAFLVATDGKRLSIAAQANDAGTADTTAILPVKVLDALVSQFSEDSVVEFSQSKQHLFFTSGDRVLMSRMLDGKFPNYQRIVPVDNNIEIRIDRTALSSALKRVGLLSELNQAVVLSFEPGAVIITSSSAEAGDALEHIALNYDGPPLKICVNWQYIIDFLAVASGSTIICRLKNNTAPLLLDDGSTFVNVVMLMRA